MPCFLAFLPLPTALLDEDAGRGAEESTDEGARYALIEEIFRLQILAIDPIVELKLAKQAAEKKARAEANAKAAESAEA